MKVPGVPRAETRCNNHHLDNPMATGLECWFSSQPCKGSVHPSPRCYCLCWSTCHQGSIPALRKTHSPQKRKVMCPEKHGVLDQYPFCSSTWYFQAFLYLEPRSFQLKSRLLSLYRATRWNKDLQICQSIQIHKEIKRGKKKWYSPHLGFAFLLKLHLNTD